MSRVLVLAVVLVVTLSSAVPVRADSCYRHCWWWTLEGCGYEQYVCEPEYNAWQYTEPDWCLYQTDDRVAVQMTGNQITGWYVWHAGDPNAISGGAVLYVVNDGNGHCYLSPW